MSNYTPPDKVRQFAQSGSNFAREMNIHFFSTFQGFHPSQGCSFAAAAAAADITAEAGLIINSVQSGY